MKNFKEKLRKLSDFPRIFRNFIIQRIFTRSGTKMFFCVWHFLDILSTFKVAIEFGV